MRSGLLRALFALVVLVPLLGCVGPTGANLPLLEQVGTDEQSYRLGPGDRLRVNVLGSEDLSREFRVGDAGTISAPLVGEVKAAGLTIRELERELERRLAQGFFREPKVNIEVITYRPFYIFGEVTKPGEYPYASGMTVLNAVALAGGYSYRANQNHVIVVRNGQERRALPTSRLLPDDIVRVPERFF